MSGAELAKIINHPSAAHIESPGDESPELTFWQRVARDLKLTTMAVPTKPYWNTSMVTAWVAVILGVVTILGSIGALYVYTKNTYLQMGIEQGEQRALDRQRDERIKELENQLKIKKALENAEER